MSDNDLKTVDRRDALKRLAKLSAYTAPAVVTLLHASSSFAQGSGVPAGSQCGARNNRNPNNPMWPNAADVGGNGSSGIGLPNSVADCGNAGANSDA